jgi:hypothetical protein
MLEGEFQGATDYDRAREVIPTTDRLLAQNFDRVSDARVRRLTRAGVLS